MCCVSVNIDKPLSFLFAHIYCNTYLQALSHTRYNAFYVAICRKSISKGIYFSYCNFPRKTVFLLFNSVCNILWFGKICYAYIHMHIQKLLFINLMDFNFTSLEYLIIIFMTLPCRNRCDGEHSSLVCFET